MAPAISCSENFVAIESMAADIAKSCISGLMLDDFTTYFDIAQYATKRICSEMRRQR